MIIASLLAKYRRQLTKRPTWEIRDCTKGTQTEQSTFQDNQTQTELTLPVVQTHSATTQTKIINQQPRISFMCDTTATAFTPKYKTIKDLFSKILLNLALDYSILRISGISNDWIREEISTDCSN